MASGRVEIDHPHVLVIPIPIHGHVHPSLQLAVRLASLGSTITFVTTSMTNSASVSVLDLLCAGSENLRQAIRFQCLVDANRSSGYGLRESIEFMAGKRDEIDNLLGNSVQELGRVSLGIVDFFVFEQLKSMVSLQGAVTAAFWTSSAAMLHFTANIETFLEERILPLFKNESEKTVVDSSLIPGLPCQLSVYTDLPDDPLDPSFNSMKEIKNSLLKAPRLLINTLDDVEEQSLHALREQGFSNLVNIGPLLPQTSNKGQALDETREWLDVHEPSSVLFVSFGTMLELPDEQLIEVGHGLEASQENFLWVLRETCQQKVAKFLESLRQRIGTRGLIVPWSSQIDVLRHPSVKGFLTHCGWNSTLESLSCGIPMIGWPSLGDQTINCKFMADVWRVGLRIQSKSSSNGSSRLVHHSEIEQVIRTLMSSDEGREMGKRANLLENKIKQAIKVSNLRLQELLPTSTVLV